MKFSQSSGTVSFVPVAPLVGAWIEIIPAAVMWWCTPLSLLSWERGLKFRHPNADVRAMIVAPLVGAWIEIGDTEKVVSRHGSLLSWERGLK